MSNCCTVFKTIYLARLNHLGHSLFVVQLDFQTKLRSMKYFEVTWISDKCIYWCQSWWMFTIYSYKIPTFWYYILAKWVLLIYEVIWICGRTHRILLGYWSNWQLQSTNIKNKNKIYQVALLITDPPPTSFTALSIFFSFFFF